MTRLTLLLAAIVFAGCATGQRPQPQDAPVAALRYNQLGYLPGRPKVVVLCSRDGRVPRAFRVRDARGQTVFGPAPVQPDSSFGPCAATGRLDFTALRAPGRYTIDAGPGLVATISISPYAYRGTADTLLAYMRQQRSLFNPLFRDSVHHRTDGIIVDHARAGTFVPVAGGWADAADYLQYVTTSAHATFALLVAVRDHAASFDDAFDALGLPGRNGVPDVLDEARWGLEWLLKMHPEDDVVFNQLGDDRDHSFLDLPTTDSSDYGWGRGGYRPVYPCTGQPQGLLQHRNRADGVASTAGKMAAAFALGAQAFRTRDPRFADSLARKARTAYEAGRRNPGVCQTAP